MQLEKRGGNAWADIFWDDLCPETREKLLELMGDNGNYDVCRIASINVSKEEEE